MKLYAIKGDTDAYSWDHWAGAFGSGKARQMLLAGIIEEV